MVRALAGGRRYARYARVAALLVGMLAGCQLPLGRPGTVVLPNPPNSPIDNDVDVAALERDLIEQVNAARVENGARALRTLESMMRAARGHAQELTARHELDHTSTQPGRSTFAQRLALAGAPAWTLAGENLIMLPYNTVDVAERAVLGWLGSASHREQMLEPTYTDTGIGVGRDEHGNWYIVQLFIRRR